MIDFDFIWRTQDEIRTVVNAVLGECIWNLSFNEKRMAIELELTVTLNDDAIDNLCCQFPISADYFQPNWIAKRKNASKVFENKKTPPLIGFKEK